MILCGAETPDFSALWASLERKTWRHALYGPKNLQFYSAYFGHVFVDRSVVAVIGDEPVAGLRVTEHRREDGTTVFSAFGQPTLYVESHHAGVRGRRDSYAAIKAHVRELLARSDSWSWDHAEHLADGSLTPLGRHLLSGGGVPLVAAVQVIDLRQTEDTLFSELSKSFRWSVNWGRKNLKLSLLDKTSVRSTDIEAFRRLHVEAAGRETRSHATWLAQLEMVQAGEAFVCLGEINGELVTAALFPCSTDHCYYGVSASRRDLFDKPVSHVLLWNAICHARALGCISFETGEIRYPYQSPSPTAKELGISTFKRGFGGETRVRMRVVASGERAVDQ